MRRSPKPGAFDGRHLQAAAQLVDDQGRERLAFDVLGDDQERLAGLNHGFEDRQHRLQRRQLLLVDEDVGVLELGDHLLRIGDEIRGQVAAIELHALDDIELGVGGLGLLDRDDALVADLLHGVSDHLANGSVTIGRNRADLRNLFGRLHLLGASLDVLHDLGGCEVDAALQIHRVHAGGDRLGALAHDRGSEHRRGRRTVTGNVAGFGSDLAHHLGAHVLELVGKLDLLGDRDAVLGNARRAERFVEHDVTTLWAEGDLHGIGEQFDAAQHPVTRIRREFYVFGRHELPPAKMR